MISITNERGEPIEFPPGGITIRELFESFGNARINIITDAVSADEKAAQIDNNEELNGFIEEPEIHRYPLIVKSGNNYTVRSLAVRINDGDATVRLIVDGIPSIELPATTFLQTLDVNLPLLSGKELDLEVTDVDGADELAFTIALVK